MNCPCCGSRIPSITTVERAAQAMPRVQRKLLTVLARHFGSFVSTERIANAVWADDMGGGPLNAPVCISQAAARVRKGLAPFGITIECKHSLGYRVKELAA